MQPSPPPGIPGGGRSPQNRTAAESTRVYSRQSARRLRKKNSRAGDRHRALALSSQFGHTEIVRMLLDARVGTTLLGAIRTRPPGIRPLWRDIAMLFDCSSSVACGWLKDAIWQGTPAEWAGHEGRDEIEKFLRSREQEGDVRCWPTSSVTGSPRDGSYLGVSCRRRVARRRVSARGLKIELTGGSRPI